MPDARPDPWPGRRGPWDIPDDADVFEPDFSVGIDTDADGVPDTVVVDDGFDLLVATDLDGDGVADQLLRLPPDGSIHTIEPAHQWGPELPKAAEVQGREAELGP
ncbi:MAG: hypothetical protein L0H84_12260 [Pseudonocardia sp.]|nr:hypothetical protein [Pseudonocardia sp.]